MTQPELFIDQAQRLIDGRALFRADLDVGKSEELEDLVLGTPDAAKLILRPAARGRRDDLALSGALAGPAASLEILFENLDWRSVVAFVLNLFLAQVHASGLAFRPPRFGVVGPVAEPPTLASSAAIRALRASFSSRA